MTSARPLAAALALVALSVAGLQGQQQAEASSLGEARAQAADLRARLADLRASSAESIVRLEQAETQLGQAVTESIALERQLDEARAEARGSDDQLRRRVSALYRSGGSVGLWSTLLEARSPSELVSRMANVDAVVAADARVVGTAREGTQRLEVLERDAGSNAELRIRAAKVAQTETDALARSMADQAAALAAATEQVRGLVEQQRVAAAAEATRVLVREQAASRAAASRAAARASAVSASSGGAPAGPFTAILAGAYIGPPGVCPVGPVHSFTDTWGAPRSGGRRHQGADVFAPYGAPAYAVVDGVIDRWSNSGLGGIALWLRGDDGDRYYYAHNVMNVAPVGSRVQAGQLVAYVGTTGNAATTPPHIHFEAHPGGGPARNPTPWLKAICSG